MNQRVRLVFCGEVLPGFKAEDVKRELGRQLKLEGAKLDALFSGASKVLKHSLGPDEAARYITGLARVGARIQVQVEPQKPIEQPPSLGQKSVSPPGGTSSASPTQPGAQLDAENKAEATRLAKSWVRQAKHSREPSEPAYVFDDGPPLLGTKFQGRMARLPYVTTAASFTALLCLVVGAAVKLSSAFFWLLGGTLTIGCLFLVVRVSVFRWHDIGRSGKWSVLQFSPVGVAVSLWLALMPGTSGNNIFGGPPRGGRISHMWMALLVMSLSAVWMFRLIFLSITTVNIPSRGMGESADRVAAEKKLPMPSEAMVGVYLISAKAVVAFREVYWQAQWHKAFAANTTGSWGWKAQMATPEDAEHGALKSCEQGRRPTTPPCKIINVNGQWMPR